MSESWTEVLVVVPAGWAELVGGLLAELCAGGVAHGLPSLGSAPLPPGAEAVRAYVPAERDDEGFRRSVARALAALPARAGAPELAGLVPRFRALPPEDFASSWKKTWRPFRAGRVAVVPSHFEGRLRPDDVRLVLDPGSAFGTGRHATTRLCLLALQEHARPGARVLDAGTGSGILAVAAALLGAERVLAFDVDETAVRGARALAAANGVAERCAIRAGGFEVLGPEDGAFDLAVANLYADLLVEHAADLAARLAPGGTLVVSGFAAARREAVLAALAAAGRPARALRARGRWLLALA